jgi:hypothetical protein
MKYLYNAISEDTAHIAENYPWGYTLKTSAKFWIETNKRGARSCQRTKNPKTGLWCKTKKSTYSPVMILAFDEDSKHHSFVGLGNYSSDLDQINRFKEEHGNNLSKEQLDEVFLLQARNEVMKHVTFTIEPTSYGSVNLLSSKPEDIAKRELIALEQEARKLEQKKIEGKISGAIMGRYSELANR